MNIGGTEVILILVVALLLFGAKNLPKIARSMGKSVEEFRRAAREVSREVMMADQPDPPTPTAAPRQIASSGTPTAEPHLDEGPSSTPAGPLEADAPAPTPSPDQLAHGGEPQKESPDEGRG